MAVSRLKEEKIKAPLFQNVKFEAKKIVSIYFGDALHYVFYSMLTFAWIGLFFGKQYDVEFFIILGLLACAKLGGYVYAEWTERNKEL